MFQFQTQESKVKGCNKTYMIKVSGHFGAKFQIFRMSGQKCNPILRNWVFGIQNIRGQKKRGQLSNKGFQML